MKKITFIKLISGLLFLWFMFNNNAVFSQDMIAKIKYEEAESAFAKGEFQATINKIDEVEAILKKTSPKTLYLKIMSQYNLETPSLSVLKSLNANCTYYLNTYGQVEGIEEKYRDVYKVAEAIKQYPQTDLAYDKWLADRKKQISDAQIEKQKLNQANLIIDKLNTWNEICAGIKIGINESEVPNSAWNYLDRSGGTIYDKGYNGYSWTYNQRMTCYSSKFKYGSFRSSSEGLSSLWVDADTKKIIHVSNNLLVGGKSSSELAKNKYEALSKKLKDHFGVENVVEKEVTTPISKNSSSYSKSITLPQTSPIVISYSLDIHNYGGIAGTEVSVSETYSLPNLWTFKK